MVSGRGRMVVVKRLVLVLLSALLLFPVWMMFVGSLQDLYGVFIMPPRLLPLHATLENYRWLLDLGIGRWAINTSIVVGLSVVLSVFVAVTAGYAFAFYRFPAKEILWVVLLLGIMIPRMSMIVPLFVVMRKLGLSGSLIASLLPTAYMPVSIYISRLYFQTVPESLLESARIDGATEATILARVVAPVSRPIVTACALFAAIASLGDYLWQMLQLMRTERQTLLVGLIKASMNRGGNVMAINPIGRSFAVGVVLVLPLLVIFLTANRYFTSALGGAIKG